MVRNYFGWINGRVHLCFSACLGVLRVRALHSSFVRGVVRRRLVLIVLNRYVALLRRSDLSGFLGTLNLSRSHCLYIRLFPRFWIHFTFPPKFYSRHVLGLICLFGLCSSFLVCYPNFPTISHSGKISLILIRYFLCLWLLLCGLYFILFLVFGPSGLWGS